MYFHQFYLGCLAHASYLIGADGEAAVVDPQRDVEQYVQEAAAQGLQIKYISLWQRSMLKITAMACRKSKWGLASIRAK
jgi:hypothetical protein